MEPSWFLVDDDLVFESVGEGAGEGAGEGVGVTIVLAVFWATA